MGHIFIPNPVAESVVQRLGANHRVTLGYGESAASWEDVADTVEATLVRGDIISRDRISAAPHLRIIARHGVGTNNVDLDAAAERGIWVTTTPGANARAVAEHVFASLLTLMRHTVEAHLNVSRGNWNSGRTALVGVELHGKTLLLIGGGGIARMVAPIALGFGMRVLVHDPYLTTDDAETFGATLVDLDEAIPEADVVSVHVPLVPETRHLLDDRRLHLMKPTAYVVNTSRGGIVDEEALVRCLRTGRLAGAALDVIDAESVDMMEPIPHSDLDFSAPNLLVTPHIGGQTVESLDAVGALAAESVEVALAGGLPPRALDLPVPSQGA